MAKLDQAEITNDIKKALVVVMDRVDMDFKNIDSTVVDISTEFKHLTLLDIRAALKKGALGQYGRAFKLSTHEVCYWIKEYVKEKQKSPLNKNRPVS